jgi:hypothetical protein
MGAPPGSAPRHAPGVTDSPFSCAVRRLPLAAHAATVVPRNQTMGGRAMRTMLLFAATLALAAPATASDWQDIKDPQALKQLYSNKTFRGKDYLDRPFVGHYRADGQGIMLAQDMRIPRSWSVKGNDQVCVKLPWQVACFRLQRHALKPGVYRSINVANAMATEFTVEDGVPQF